MLNLLLMKDIRLNRKSFSVKLLLLVLLITGCSRIEEGLTVITWRLNFDLIQTTWDVQFTDARTGEMIGAKTGSQVTVGLSGTDHSMILDLAGKNRRQFLSTNGFLSLALHPDRNDPTQSFPVTFMIHARAEGYLPVSYPVVCHEKGLHPVQINMVSVGEAPAHVGVVTQNNISRVVDGRIQDSLEFMTPLNQASLLIPQGTRMVDARAAELGGSLNIRFAYWESFHSESVTAFPGGQMAITSGSGGVAHQAHPAGIFFIDVVDAYDKPAVFFDGPLEVTLLINPDSYNPEKGRLISPTDAVTLWHQDESNGTYEAVHTIQLSAFQNKILAKIPVTGSGYYLLGWIEDASCDAPLKLQLNTLPEYRVPPYAFRAGVYQVFNDQVRLIRNLALGGASGAESHIYGLPVNTEIIIRFGSYLQHTNGYYRAPDPLLLADACHVQTVSLDMLPFTQSSFREVHPVFIDTEHNNTRYTPQVFPGYYRKKGTTDWNSAFVFEGKAYVINPEPGVIYQLGINFKGEFHEKEVIFGDEEIVTIEIEID